MAWAELLTHDERQALIAITVNLDTIGEMFAEGTGTPESLRMAIESVQTGVDVLRNVCDRWEEATA
jgi:hypothetical protein